MLIGMRPCSISLVCALALLSAATLASADPEFPFVELPAGSELSANCRASRDEAVSLLPEARACETDSDGAHFPCSCSALGTSASAERYKALVMELGRHCHAGIVYAYCGSTRPTCANRVCVARPAENE
jgi:hypothetical protein